MATKGINEEQLATWRAFLRAHSTMLRRISRDLEDEGLPPLTWYDVLAALRDAPEGRLRQVELADRVLISHSGLSRLLDRICKQGLAERTVCDTDRRAFHIELTDEGREMLDRMWPVYAKGLAEDFFPALGTDPCEMRKTLEAIGAQCEAVAAARAEAEAEQAAQAAGSPA